MYTCIRTRVGLSLSSDTVKQHYLAQPKFVQIYFLQGSEIAEAEVAKVGGAPELAEVSQGEEG